MDRRTTMPLVSGHTYYLAQSVGAAAADGDRRRAASTFQVLPGQITRLSFPVYLNENKYVAWRNQNKAADETRGPKRGHDERAAPVEWF
jgi:hypothetical protein